MGGTAQTRRMDRSGLLPARFPDGTGPTGARLDTRLMTAAPGAAPTIRAIRRDPESTKISQFVAVLRPIIEVTLTYPSSIGTHTSFPETATMKMESFAEVGLQMDVATAMTKGSRDYQQDSVLTSFSLGQETGFAIIADGMGGSVAGHVASAIATLSVFEHLKMQDLEDDPAGVTPTVLLREAAEAANRKICAHAARHDEAYGMGTTLLVPWIQQNKLFWISIGDSPLFLFRDGALRMLNQLHSMATQIDMMVKVGALDAEAARDHPDRSVLSSALNGKEIPSIDCPAVPLALKPGDILVASTDGLQTLSNAVIANTLMLTRQAYSIDTAKALLAALEAQNKVDQDNAAIVVIKVGDAMVKSGLRRADDIPVLAVADAAPSPVVEVVAAPESPPKKKRTFWYRGQEYEKDD